MTTYQNAKELNKLTLGKTTQYCSSYDANLLQAVPRSLNRNDLAMSQTNLPFYGEDVWYGYELSWLNTKGKPVVAVAEFRFPCTSENIVESKSFKLYLNSFNQTSFPSWQAVEEILSKDLSATCQGQALVTLYPVDDCPALAINQAQATCIDDLDIEINDYNFNASLLENSQGLGDESQKLTASGNEVKHVVSHLLKSNCLITNQPDWASLYISYQGDEISQEALLRYIISFREHNEFHEQCVERIFCDLQQYCQLSQLTVFARYTRRGGLDINPYRSTHDNQAPTIRTLRQ